MRRLLATAFLILGLLLPGQSPAVAEPTPLPQPTADDHNPIGACAAAGQVWLLVVDEDGRVLANQCVGTPANGEQALADAGMRIQFGRSRLICTIDSHPETCPASFDGRYWQYWHAAPGQPWTFSSLGATSHHPAPGSVEGWCYNKLGQEHCAMPTLRVVHDGAETHVGDPNRQPPLDLDVAVHAPVPLPSTAPWELIAALGCGAALVGGTLLWRRRRRPGAEPAELGGR